MKMETAIKQLRKDAEFLGLDFAEMLKFIEKSPLAQTQRTLEAYKVFTKA
jgi:hypothetical protein